MHAKTTLSLTEARKLFFQIIEAIQTPGTYYTLTQNGKPKAVLLSAEEFESWQETVEVLSDPKIYSELTSAEADIQKGNYVSLEQILKKEGYVLADKPKQKYGISNKNKQRSSKKPRKDSSSF